MMQSPVGAVVQQTDFHRPVGALYARIEERTDTQPHEVHVIQLAPDAPLHIFHKSVHLHVEPLHIDQ